MTEEQKRRLEAQLWAIANDLRGKMNADEFRDYILGFIFYKYLSERINNFVTLQLEYDGISYSEAAQDTKLMAGLQEEAINTLGYFLPYNLLFSTLVAKEKEIDILEDLQNAFNAIERSTDGKDSEDDFNHLFEDIDLNSTKLGRTHTERNELIGKILKRLDKIEFSVEDSNSDILGDAYEYLIGQFAAGAGKKAGEFYTPAQVSTLLARLVTTRKKSLKSVYDPTCGSGSLLLRINRQEGVDVGQFYGQELNRTTYNLARMNMLLHGIKYQDFDIHQEDTLKKPQHRGMQFDAVVANPPFSAHWEPSLEMEGDDRFSQYGKLAPKTKADYAFIQHMIAQLAENGTMAVIAPHGVLFRGAAEGHIRRYLIENRNYLDAVIGLPANLFYGTSIPTCIIVFKKCRENPNDILFIDASNEFTKVKTQNYLEDEHIDKIIQTYTNCETIDKYSYKASLEEIAENDYNLNIPRYVDTFEEEEPIDLAAVTAAIKQIDADMVEIDRKIAGYCAELGIESPF